jgi:glutamyl-tRNA synthetase
MGNSSDKSVVRVRFAPSPTGHLHIGGLRTALFNWLFARHNKGTFLLRIEDTDIERSKPEYLHSILSALEWALIMGDEEPVIQTHSVETHKKLIKKLLDEGKAYKCYCPLATDVESINYFRYGSLCRMKEPLATDQSYVVRIKLPHDQEHITFNDLIRGPVSFPLDQFDDFIIARSDGTPIYNFVVVADDAAMEITHVIRGEDHIPNTPKQIVLYNALGFQIPKFAHLPLILGPSGAPLSKRDAATSVLDYRKNGYLAHALCNYLVRLGWSHGDQEIFSIDELINYFTLENVGKKGAIFDQKKLDWVNGIYLRQTSDQEIIDLIQRDVDHNFCADLSQWTHKQLVGFIALYKERSSTLLELSSKLRALYLHNQPISEEEKIQWIKENTVLYLRTVVEELVKSSQYSSEYLKNLIKTISKNVGIPLVELAQPIRLALTATTSSPGIFELMDLLGKNETVKRLEQFITKIAESNSEKR